MEGKLLTPLRDRSIWILSCKQAALVLSLSELGSFSGAKKRSPTSDHSSCSCVCLDWRGFLASVSQWLQALQCIRHQSHP